MCVQYDHSRVAEPFPSLPLGAALFHTKGPRFARVDQACISDIGELGLRPVSVMLVVTVLSLGLALPRAPRATMSVVSADLFATDAWKTLQLELVRGADEKPRPEP